MTPSEACVRTLYESVKRNDPAAAAACYCDVATYRDIAFDLSGKADIAAIWRFVCARGVDVEYCDIRTEGSAVKGHWTFRYKFHGVHPVCNEMDSTFTFRDGKILAQHDKASRWKWAKQALGFPKDVVVTVFPVVLRNQARKELDAFLAKERAGQPA